jgi:KDO2-lipid IV(A) lauroyltransferase
MAFDVIRYRRGMVINNVKEALGDSKSPEEIKAIARECWYHFFLTGLEFLHGKQNDIAANITLVNPEFLREAIAKEQGAFILVFHGGNWEAMGVKCSRTFRPTHVPVKKVGSDSVNQFVTELREKAGFVPVKRKSSGDGYRNIRKALKGGDVVGFIMDQSRPGEPRLPFFGRPAKTNTTLAKIWAKSGHPPIIPAYIKRISACQHELNFFPEVEMPLSGEKERDVLEQTTLFNRILEEHIKKNPEQYMWMHNRWK